MFLKVKENLRQQGISTKGELSQLAVLLHELVLQVLLPGTLVLGVKVLGKSDIFLPLFGTAYSGTRLFSIRCFWKQVL